MKPAALLAQLRRALASRLLLLLLAPNLVAGGLFWARDLGLTEPAELLAYDYLLTAKPHSSSCLLTILAITDEDIDTLGWPLNDHILSGFLDKIVARNPVAIGVDLYRPMPIEPGAAQLARVIAENDKIFFAFKFPGYPPDGIAPPPGARLAGRDGFSDFVVDRGSTTRRALIYASDGRYTAHSLAMRIAERVLAERGVKLANDAATGGIRIGQTLIRPLAAGAGGYGPFDDAGYQLLMDYKRGAHCATLRRLTEIDRLAAEDFTGKIVLVGSTAPSLKDFFFTPFDRFQSYGARTFGVELHALVIDQLLRYAEGVNRPIQAAPDWSAALIRWLCCVAAAALCGLRVPLPWQLVGLATVAILVGSASWLLFQSVAVWLPVASALLGLIAVSVLIIGGDAAVERNERRMLMSLLSQNVSEKIADELWRHRRDIVSGHRLIATRLYATVMFVDLVNFTSLTEEMTPSDLLQIINFYLTLVNDKVTKHGGIVDKFIGDGVMAVFGVPVAREGEDARSEDATNAVRCALAISRALETLDPERMLSWWPRLQIRIGISSGEVTAGTVGSEGRLNYTILGDTVNIAARLQAYEDSKELTATARILVSEDTLKRVTLPMTAELVGEIKLKGKSVLVRTYSIER
jgi:adenylate cyclase